MKKFIKRFLSVCMVILMALGVNAMIAAQTGASDGIVTKQAKALDGMNEVGDIKMLYKIAPAENYDYEISVDLLPTNLSLYAWEWVNERVFDVFDETIFFSGAKKNFDFTYIPMTETYSNSNPVRKMYVKFDNEMFHEKLEESFSDLMIDFTNLVYGMNGVKIELSCNDNGYAEIELPLLSTLDKNEYEWEIDLSERYATNDCLHFDTEDKVTPATCIIPGKTEVICTDCNKVIKTYGVTEKTNHIWDNGKEVTAATCTDPGVIVYTCTVCNDEKIEKTEKLNHKDDNNDGICENCGIDISVLQSKCSHLCHKGGFLGFIWKIVRFFIKLFKVNPTCSCGAAHY